MKYLLVIAFALVLFWWLRNQRRDKTPHGDAAPRAPGTALPPTEIVECAVCHVHLPRSEALPGPGGLYCSEAHRKQAGA